MTATFRTDTSVQHLHWQAWGALGRMKNHIPQPGNDMGDTPQQDTPSSSDLNPVNNDWGAQPDDNFGYASEEERRANRGLEDWELLDKMAEPQPGVFPWFRAVVASVVIGILLFLLFAYGINFITHHFGLDLLHHGHENI